MRLVLELSRPDLADDTTGMEFDLEDTPVSRTFARLIDQANTVPTHIFTAWGMDTGFGDADEYIAVLNRGIDTFNRLNRTGHLIDYFVEKDSMDRALLNAVHDKFEHYMNAVTREDESLVSTDDKPALVDALNDVNNHVHLLESYLTRCNESGAMKSYFTARFRTQGEGKHFDSPLTDEDCEFFTMEERFGNVYVNYATTGKNLQQIYWSNDLELLRRPGGVAPQKINTAGIIALFNSAEKPHEDEFERFSKWCEANDVAACGIDISDKRNGLGLLKIGRLSPQGEIGGYYDEASGQWDCRAVIEHYAPYSSVEKMKILR